MKRIALFLATNLAIIAVLRITMRLFGFEGLLAHRRIGTRHSS